MKFITLAFLASCARPYAIVHEAALPPPCQAELLPTEFGHLQIGGLSEAAWVAKKRQSAQASWDDDKRQFAAQFGEALAEKAAPFLIARGDFVLQPEVVFYEPGFYAYAVARDTEVVMQIALVNTKTNAEIDRAEAQAVVNADLFNPSSGGRFQSAAKMLGGRLGQFVLDRLGHCVR